ncbi:MAG: ferrous iron transport protein A [Candidatus Bathyarchaeota archaeon]|nr:ferrous iron transport protein A [Candidatus Bathyarchaeota archaeon]
MGKKKVTLTKLREGETATVVSITNGFNGEGGGGCKEPGFKKRLMDMGLTPGTQVTVIKSAPFHGPVEVFVRGFRLVLGRGVAERVLVEVERDS